MTARDTATRVALWDAALGAVRGVLRGAGMREVVTPWRVDAVALEPWIEPVAAPPGLLHTSPELAMKRLLVHGSGPIFQIAQVARRGEHGAWHREQFTLVEWYRTAPALDGPIADTERLVAAVAEAVAPWRSGGYAPPSTWRRVGFLDAVEATAQLALRGDEDADALTAMVADTPWALPPLRAVTSAARTLEAWTAFFSNWSDVALDPWLRSQADAGTGVHLVEFPRALAALAEHEHDGRGRAVAGRFESHAFGRELANGYRELRDAAEQRARFDAVAALRRAHGAAPLPMPEAFLAELVRPGLPPCAGAAAGLDRLIALAVGAEALDDIALAP